MNPTNDAVRTGPVETWWRWVPPSAPGARQALFWWLRGWPAACHLIIDLVLAVPYLLLTCFLILAVCLLPVFGAGLPLLLGVLAGASVLARLDLLRLRSMTGERLEWIGTPGRRATSSFWRDRLLDGAGWRAMAWVAFQSVWGLTTGVIVLVLASVSLALALAPVYVWLLPDTGMYWPWGSTTSGWWWLMLVFTVGLAGVLLTPLTATGLIVVNVLLARGLLTRTANTEQVRQLNQRVQTLTRTRAAAVDSVEAERQRIERDLHDGPQQRLVAIAMDLGLAQDRLDRDDPDGARDLMNRAHSAAKDAVVEMRQVARGIHPPILTDRGLDAALSALAAGAPVPVSVQVVLTTRPDPTVEAIAYFCVSEALTNVAKHARAKQAQVLVGEVGEWLRIEVEDDGVGGARPGGDGGTGLRGLADRVAAIDGAVHLSSPAGGPTVLTLHLPLTVRSAS